MHIRILLATQVALATATLSSQDLLVDFNSTNQDGGPHPQTGYQAYNAAHEVPADFITRSFPAFGATIDITPAWPNTTDNRVQQMIDRGGGNDNNWNNASGDVDLITDFLGIDTRPNNGGNGNWDGAAGGTPTYMTLTLGGLPAGTYGWTSFHHDTENVHTNFQIEISIDGGTSFTSLGQEFYMSDSTSGGNPDSANNGAGGTRTGPDATTLDSTATFQIDANGTNDVVLRFAPLSGALGSAVHTQIWGINGFQLTPLDDTDGDGLADSFEQGIIAADPNDAIATLEDVLPGDDFDNDGSTNQEEHDNQTDPSDDDSDDDGLLDGEEVSADNGSVTDPNNADTDGDGLSDGVEDGGGAWVSANQTGTNPLNADSDDDGLGDGAENPDLPFDVASPLTQPGSDPNQADTDGDGVDDRQEALDLTDPGDPADFRDPLVAGPSLRIDFNSNQDGGGNSVGFNPEEVASAHLETDFAPYHANHETAAEFSVGTYSAFGGVDNITIEPSWPDTTDRRVMQSIDRGAGNDNNWGGSRLDLLTDWIGADTRTGNGGNGPYDGVNGTPTRMLLTIGGIPAGSYSWRSYHHDTEHMNGLFTMEISTDGGDNFTPVGDVHRITDSTPGGNPASITTYDGINNPASGDPAELPSTINTLFTSNGADAIVIRLTPYSVAAVHASFVVLNGFEIDRIGRADKMPLDITHLPATDELRLSWESEAGKLYNLRSTLDPGSAAPLEWPVFGGHIDLVATPPENTLTIPLPDELSRFFVVEEFNAPPVIFFEDDLESGAQGWSTAVNDATGTTQWELGSPSGSTGPLTGANGSANAWSTNLGDYGPNSNISLRSPTIDLSDATSAELTFEAFRDADGFGDSAVVRFLRASDQTQLGAETDIDMEVFDSSYRSLSIPVTAEALGENVIIEWTFVSDASADAFSGLTIDNIEVAE